jgi:phosphoglycolate phosphatase-like HAD superfamily hydrolase
MYVGDDVRDAQTAYNAGCVGVLIGSHVGEQLPPGTLQVASFGDAIDLIERRYEQVRSW